MTELYARAYIAPLQDGPDLLQRINALAPDPFASLEDVYTFRGVQSRNVADTYFTIMDDATLANFEADYKRSQPLMGKHDYKSLPIGRSFDATRVAGSGDNELGQPVRELVVSYYVQRTASNQETIDLIRGGTYRDLSVGFTYETGLCSVCGKNQLPGRDGKIECRVHMPGLVRDGVMCYQRVMDGHAKEGSLVWSASCPDAYIIRARALQKAGELSSPQIRLLEETYHTTINPQFAGVGVKNMNELTRLVQGVFTRAGAALSAANKAKIQSAIDALDKAEDAVDAAENLLLELIGAAQEAPEQEARAAHSELETRSADYTRAATELATTQAELTAVRAAIGGDIQPAAIKQLVTQAADGRAYRATKVQQAGTAYTQATNQPADLMASLLQTASLDQLDALTATWQGQTRTEFANMDEHGQPQGIGVRQTTPDPINPNSKSANPDAYRIGRR